MLQTQITVGFLVFVSFYDYSAARIISQRSFRRKDEAGKVEQNPRARNTLKFVFRKKLQVFFVYGIPFLLDVTDQCICGSDWLFARLRVTCGRSFVQPANHC